MQSTIDKESSSNLDQAIAVIKRGASDLINEETLRAKLRENRPLLVKLGADPSAPDIHLGHVVVLKKLRDFQRLGHEVCFVIGDFTARIGDPTGRSKTRPVLSAEQVRANAASYQEQIGKVLDPQKTRVVFNSTWSEKLNLSDVLKLSAQTTVAQLLERDDFMKRYKAGEPIALVEFFYPIMQAFDSVELKADVELGGSDQTFNLLFARDFQREFGQSPQVVLTLPLLVGLDGHQKMSKSLGNYIGISEPPREMFGKVMSIPDALILDYFTLLTDRLMEDIETMRKAMEAGENPRDFKRKLAMDIVTMFHDAEHAKESADEFTRVFSSGGLPDEAAIVPLEVSTKTDEQSLLAVLMSTGTFSSKSEARRLIAGNGVKLEGTALRDDHAVLDFRDGMILRVGKRRFFRLHHAPA